jgi:hypothetical protein
MTSTLDSLRFFLLFSSSSLDEDSDPVFFVLFSASCFSVINPLYSRRMRFLETRTFISRFILAFFIRQHGTDQHGTDQLGMGL